MSDPKKKLFNPLFSASVTSNTLDDFSQNAVLFPASISSSTPAVNDQLKKDPSSEQSSPFERLQEIPKSSLFELSANSSFYPVESNLETTGVPSLPNTVVNPTAQDFVSPVASISNERLIEKEKTNIQFLSQSSDIPPLGVTSRSTGLSNPHRRLTTKRPVYAPAPGLTIERSTQPVPPLSSYFQPHDSINQKSTSIQSPSSELQLPFVSQNQVAASEKFQASSVMSAIPANEISVMDSNLQKTEISSTGSSFASSSQNYRSVYQHWFYNEKIEGKIIWCPFSMADSLDLEQQFTSTNLDPEQAIATNGGRYDVNILRRERVPVYWNGEPTEVRRCSWFYKCSVDGCFVPYEENIATLLENEYKNAFENSQWNRVVDLPNSEKVILHSPDSFELFTSHVPELWSNTQVTQERPKIVKRGLDEFNIDDGEPDEIDHLLFLVHGIGSVCDLKFRSVEEVVNEFRAISLQLVQSHYRLSCDSGKVHRIEVLPISWHTDLHSEETGIDKKLKSITLESVPRFRKFTNDTVLDVLFYTSPLYSQTIISTVGNQLNAIYDLFKTRNPTFKGGVSLGGHSLGSLILFDLLAHQQPLSDTETISEDEDDVTTQPIKPPPIKRRMSRRYSYMMTVRGTGQPQLHYPHLSFQPKSLFALGSPIGMFVTVRGLDLLGDQFALPTCEAFYNIFHPYDPVAYRIEPLINPELADLKPVLVPHHKGRKRMHLELKETMLRVGTDIKQKLLDSVKNTWNSFYQLAMFHRDDKTLEEEVNKALESELLEKEPQVQESVQPNTIDKSYGILNKGRRIDYVLQESPFEMFNEYIFAVRSHLCYWESEDTMLLILKEIYSSMNVETDNQMPQPSMTIERKTSPFSDTCKDPLQKNNVIGMNPTVPIQQKTVGPPPTSGFVPKP